MATRQSQRALTKEYQRITENPPPYIVAKPNETNILEWHYVITGPPETPFEGGQYHGMLRFPKEYPFKPPSISMITPNGRFACNTRLCLSMSDYHPDTWNPAWSVSTILTGLLSFMTGDESTAGSITTSDNVKRRLSRESKEWNLKENQRFLKQFGELAQKNVTDIEEAKAKELENKKAGIAKTYDDSEQPINIDENIDMLDPEDRARLSQQGDYSPSGIPSLTVVGIAAAAFLALYFSFIRG